MAPPTLLENLYYKLRNGNFPFTSIYIAHLPVENDIFHVDFELFTMQNC